MSFLFYRWKGATQLFLQPTNGKKCKLPLEISVLEFMNFQSSNLVCIEEDRWVHTYAQETPIKKMEKLYMKLLAGKKWLTWINFGWLNDAMFIFLLLIFKKCYASL